MKLSVSCSKFELPSDVPPLGATDFQFLMDAAQEASGGFCAGPTADSAEALAEGASCSGRMSVSCSKTELPSIVPPPGATDFQFLMDAAQEARDAQQPQSCSNADDILFPDEIAKRRQAKRGKPARNPDTPTSQGGKECEELSIIHSRESEKGEGQGREGQGSQRGGHCDRGLSARIA